MQHNPGFLTLVNESRTRIRETNPDGVKARQDAGEAFRLIDVREESEWAAGRLPGAEHLGKGIIERDIERLIPAVDAPIVLYCGGGYRSALAADVLQSMGYTDVWSMDGGFKGWVAAGYVVLKDAT